MMFSYWLVGIQFNFSNGNPTVLSPNSTGQPGVCWPNHVLRLHMLHFTCPRVLNFNEIQYNINTIYC